MYYYQLVRSCPITLIILTFAISFGLFTLSLYHNRLPSSFDDPTIGFEVRNTNLSARLNTWRLLIESTSWNGLLSLYPKPYETKSSTTTSTTTTTTTTTQQPKTRKPKLKNGKHSNRNKTSTTTTTTTSTIDPFNSKNHHLIMESEIFDSDSGETQFFCGKLMEDYIQFIVEPIDNGISSNLLELETIRNLCHLDQNILRMNEANNETNLFQDNCETANHQKCCPSWSISSYLLYQHHQQQQSPSSSSLIDCESIVQSDIDSLINLLHNCSEFYSDQYLNEDCTIDDPGSCPNVPEHCYGQQNIVYNIFHYMVDHKFMDMDQLILNRSQSTNIENNRPSITTTPNTAIKLSVTNIFLPIAKSSKLMNYYDRIMQHSKLSYGNVHVVAADLGLKHSLFSRHLIQDLTLICIASGIIFTSLLLYTRSFLLTITAMVTNIASLGSAYFIYTDLMQIKFFPFLNLLCLIILIGIGSDNALIYCKAWCCCRTSSTTSTITSSSTISSPSSSSNMNMMEYHRQMSTALWHVLISSFSASLTTCCAFFAGYFTQITSLKCFSIFAGTAIVTNFIITIITFPSAIVLSDRLSLWCSSSSSSSSTSSKKNNHQRDDDDDDDDNESISLKILQFPSFLFGQWILKLIFNYRYYLTIIYTILALMAMIVVLYFPGLRMPTTQEFQIFSSNHLFELYDRHYRNEFWFNRFSTMRIDSSGPNGMDNEMSKVVLPIRIIFGILPIDNGNDLNPFDRGTLQFDPQFDITKPESQIWLLDFCRDLRMQPFYRPMVGPQLTNCFIETFKSWMEHRRCTEYVGNRKIDRFPCCSVSTFPYEPSVFRQCLTEETEILHRTPNYLFSPNRAGPRFNTTKIGHVETFVIEYDSIYDAFINRYETIEDRWNTLNGWIESQIRSAPIGLRSGWFVTINTEFFALQQSLSSGVLRSVWIAVIFAFATLICTTRNIRLSILSTITITFLIFTTIGALILCGWQLNVIESITISLTIGLAIDATLHYTIAYQLLAKGNRLLGIQMTLARIGSPVAMGSCTTFLAGSIMLYSDILAYIQIGTFMMLLSVISWSFSTIFHLSLLIIFGETREDDKRMTSLIGFIRSRIRSILSSNNNCPKKDHQIKDGGGGDDDSDQPQMKTTSATIDQQIDNIDCHLLSNNKTIDQLETKIKKTTQEMIYLRVTSI
ncbi:Protein dispatched 1 [Blomia tropicalis]|nr:Protein dispatched 1 [Blomia tropicalis]